MICSIINVGTELLLGNILNTNAQYLSEELAKLGISVMEIIVVGDNEKRLDNALSLALSQSDMIITTGGLGPTADDLTKEVCARTLGIELVLHEESLKRMKDFFIGFGHSEDQIPKTNEKQAYMPKDQTVFTNHCGTAPGCAMEKGGKTVILLPGPPREMKLMFENEVKPFLSKYSGGVIASHNVKTYGIGESAMAEICSDLLEKENPTVAPYAKEGEAFLRVTAKADTQEKAEEMMKPVIDDIIKRLGTLVVYGVDVDNMAHAVVTLLTKTGKKLAVAESCTGGIISKMITDIAGASKVFEYGMVSYSNRTKEEFLDVSPDTIKEYTEVSENTAKEMALGALKKSGADIAVSATGYAGPDDADGLPTGLSYIAVADKDEVWAMEINTKRRWARDLNRFITANQALNMVRLYLEDRLNDD